MVRKKASKKDVNLPILQLGQGPSATPGQTSGRGRIRACVLIFVHLIILLHITHFWIAGRSLSPVEPSEAIYTIELGQVNAGAIFFGLAILGTAIFGRFFCGWACHLVALQDFCGYLLRRIGIRPKPLRSRLLALVPFGLAFYMFLWPTFKRLLRGDSHPGLSNYLMTENFWYTFPGPVVSILTFVVCGGLIVYLLGNKGFCTYACPYGAFFSISDRVALGRIRVTDACQQCGVCTANCTSNVSVSAEVRDYGMVVDPGCMKCMDCVSVCPNDALYFGLREKPGQQTSKRASQKPRRKKSYDFSLGEELSALIVALFTIYALRSLYNLVPLLLAVALGVLGAYFTIQFFRMFRKRDLRIQNFRLKRDGRFTTFGQCAIALFCVWTVFVFHSSVVQYHRYQGRSHLKSVPAPWNDLLDGRVQPEFTPQDRENVAKILHHYGVSDRFGLLNVLEVKVGLTLGSMMNNDLESAEKYLREAYEIDPLAVREMFAEFLVNQDRTDEANELYKQQ